MAFFKFNKLLHKIQMDLSDKPEIYQTINILTLVLKEEVRKKKLSSIEIHKAAEQLQSKLSDAMHSFDEKIKHEINRVQYIAILQTFAEDCHSAIFAYQPTLMSAPGLWNQLKAIINNFLEQYFAISPLFNTDKSELGLKNEFSNNFNQAKNQLMPASDEEDPCALSSKN